MKVKARKPLVKMSREPAPAKCVPRGDGAAEIFLRGNHMVQESEAQKDVGISKQVTRYLLRKDMVAYSYMIKDNAMYL